MASNSCYGYYSSDSSECEKCEGKNTCKSSSDFNSSMGGISYSSRYNNVSRKAYSEEYLMDFAAGIKRDI